MAEPGETMPAAVEGLALIDAAASRTRADQDTGSRADLNGMDRGSISSVSHSAHSVPVFACEIEVAGLGKTRLPRAMGGALADPRLIAVIGRAALRSTVFVHTGLTGHFSIARRLCISIRWDLNRTRACDQNPKISEAYLATVGRLLPCVIQPDR